VESYQSTHSKPSGSAPPEALILLTPVENPRQFGVAVLDDQGQVVRLVEKPQEWISDLALVGVYLFGPSLHDVIAGLHPSARGEYEITDAIQGLIERGLRVQAQSVRGWWKDTGKAEDLLDANRLVLSQIRRYLQGESLDSQIVGEVITEPGCQIIRSLVRGPAHIAAGAVIEDSYVGPYTSIGGDARIIRSELEYSIVMNQAVLRDLPYRVDASVIGQGVQVHRSEASRKHTLQLVLGDGSRVQL
jgi:glucose-1-phosphate thymidylyltransferase